jgi:23S rRNA (cytidine2498-2'-O)-methyltransferase
MATRGRARAPRGPSTGDLYIGGPHVADLLALELASLGKNDALEIAPGVVMTRASALVDPAFARQAMPAARLVTLDPHHTSGGANALATMLLDAVATDGSVSLDTGDVEVTLPEVARRGRRPLEGHPLEAARLQLDDVLRKKIAGRQAKRLAAGAPSVAPTGHRARVLLVDAWSAWLSVARAPTGPALLAWPSPFPGGRPFFLGGEGTTDAPSSAHRKIDEALAWLEQGPDEGDIVLDLGAAPGGWSFAALQRGARVIAVDRADLDQHIARHPRLQHVRADAFRYVPQHQPSWLLCDVIAEPERSLEVVERAIASTALRGLVVTLKLKRPVKLDVIKRARALCKATPGFFGRTKNLTANKLEVTVMMRRA